MAKFGFIGPSYTAASSAIADEECINWFAETAETAAPQSQKSYLGTPGLKLFSALPDSPVRGSCWTGSRLFVVAGTKLLEISSTGVQTVRGTVANDNNPVSIALSNIEMLIVSDTKAYCYTLATNALVDVTSSLVGVPKQVEYSDGYFIMLLANSNKFQMSDPLDGTTWPGLYVNEVTVFPENIVSIIVNHRELWVFGGAHAQPYQDTGSDNIFDVIGGALVEKGCAATFAPCRIDNSVFWIDEDARGGRCAWRSSGYTPQRISTYAVESDLTSYADVSGIVTYSYQESGHLFWAVYVPGAPWTWVYDVAENMWAKRATWLPVSGQWQAHPAWNHVYAFGKHLVGDWQTGNLYEMSMGYLDDNGSLIRRLRRSPTLNNEMSWVGHAELTVDFQTGLGPQPPLTDGDGNDRAPQAMLRWSDNRGETWSNEHIADCGMAGEYNTRVIWRRLGRSRYRVYELSVSDPIKWAIVDAYLRVSA